MKKKKLLSLGILTLATLVFGGSLVFYVSESMSLVPVYMYNQNIKQINTMASPEHFTIVEIPKIAVTSDFITSIEGIEDLAYNTRVYQGNYAYSSQLSKVEHLDPFDSMDLSKMRRVSLPVDYATALAGNIKRGDRIDLIFSDSGQYADPETGISSNFTYAKSTFQNILVESVSTSNGYIFVDHSTTTADKASQEQMSGDIGIITLALTLEEAEELKARQGKGTLSVIGRFDGSKDYETLGYVIGDYSKIFSGSANAETGRTVIENTQQ